MTMTLQDVINTESGQFIKDFYARVSGQVFENKTRNNKLFWGCTIKDPESGAEVKATFWAVNPESFGTSLIHFDGMSMKRTDDYNGTAQISVGDKAELKAVGGREPAPDSQGANKPASTPAGSQPHGQPFSKPPSVRNGQRDGMIMNNSVAIWIAQGGSGDMATEIATIALAVEKATERLEAGSAPSPQERQPQNTADYSTTSAESDSTPF